MSLNNLNAQKILILRFSSFGDVTESLSIPSFIHQHWPQSEIHWAVRSDLSSLLKNHPHIFQIHAYDKKTGLMGLIKLAFQLRKLNFTHVYDAHNSTRSRLIALITTFLKGNELLRKSQFRWKRFLLFKFRINHYEMPFSGQRDLLKPLQKWEMPFKLPEAPQLFLDSQLKTIFEKLNFPKGRWIACAPSAAFELKRWPLEYWEQLASSMLKKLPEDFHFIFLGGPEDHFIQKIIALNPSRLHNFAGKLSLTESAKVIEQSELTISNDTGLLHVAEQLGRPAIALMGPAPFGYPSRQSTQILELQLECKPCSKHGQGPCVNAKYHECLRGISPQLVEQHALKKLAL